MKPSLTVVIMTYNEEMHISRIMESVKMVASNVLVVDSYSTDRTPQLAVDLGAKLVQNRFVNQAQQFQWALDYGDITSTWVMRMDADEYLTQELVQEILSRLEGLPMETTGVILKRQVHFMGKWIRHGGYYPIKLLRIWRRGTARIEQRWMDEHLVLQEGQAVLFDHDIIDDNLNSLTWWTEKHNQYATREALDILSRKYGIGSMCEASELAPIAGQAATKRWYKNNLYLKLPMFVRAFLYFQFRYWIQLGFLDGRNGLIWHFLQGFWYRFLVDAKIIQIQYWAKSEGKSVQTILQDRFNIKN